MHYARAQNMSALSLRAHAPYLAECGVSSSLSGTGFYHNLLTDK